MRRDKRVCNDHMETFLFQTLKYNAHAHHNSKNDNLTEFLLDKLIKTVLLSSIGTNSTICTEA